MSGVTWNGDDLGGARRRGRRCWRRRDDDRRVVSLPTVTLALVDAFAHRADVGIHGPTRQPAIHAVVDHLANADQYEVARDAPRRRPAAATEVLDYLAEQLDIADLSCVKDYRGCGR